MKFAFSLAKELGMTVEWMLSSMSSDEYTYWKAYSALEREEMDAERMKVGMR
jgi:hypothetical protein